MNRKIKGFTLIELIVVMAILSILAGMLSLFIGGFVRDSRNETNNNRAQMLFTGFQNIVTRCEINNNLTEVFGTGTDLIEIDFIADEDTSSAKDWKINGTEVTDAAQLKKLTKFVADNISITFGGAVRIYIDASNYVVDSAVLSEKGDMSEVLDELSEYTDESNSSYKTVDDIGQQKTLYKKGFYVGAYPLGSAIEP